MSDHSIHNVVGFLRWIVGIGVLMSLSACILGRESAEDATAAVQIGTLHDDDAGMTSEMLRLEVMRFADRYVQAISEPIEDIKDNALTGEVRSTAHGLVYSTVFNSYDIAVGTHPEINLLDMVVLVNLTCSAVADHWVPEFFSETGEPLNHVCNQMVTDVWSLAGKVLNTEQLDELKDMIDEWRREHPHQYFVEMVRFGDFAGEIDDPALKATGSGLVGQLQLISQESDELEIMVDRLTYYMRRLPSIIRIESELAYYELISEPEMAQLLGNADQATAAMERLSVSIEGVADLFRDTGVAERKSLLDDLGGGQRTVSALLSDLNQTVRVTDQLIARVDAFTGRVAERNAAERDQGRAVPLEQYQQIVVDVGRGAERLTVLIESLERLVESRALADEIPSAVTMIQAETRRLTNYAFTLAVLFVFISAIIAILAGLVYRILAARFAG